MGFVLFAQDVTKTIPGEYSGWVGAGLLGMVLGWLLLKHLPEKDRQTRELTDAKDKQIDQLIQAKDIAVSKLTEAFHQTHSKAVEIFAQVHQTAQDAFTTRNDKTLSTFTDVIHEERETCQKWHEENRERLDAILFELKDGRHIIANLRHEIGLHRAAVTGEPNDKNIYDPIIKPKPS